MNEYEVQLTVTEHHVVTVQAHSAAEAEDAAHDTYLDTDAAYAIDKKVEHIGKIKVDSTRS